MLLRIFALLLPMALLASAAQMLASLFAKTFKEAQTYFSLLTLLSIFQVMFTMFKDVKTVDWMYLVPIMGQQNRGRIRFPTDSAKPARPILLVPRM